VEIINYGFRSPVEVPKFFAKLHPYSYSKMEFAHSVKSAMLNLQILEGDLVAVLLGTLDLTPISHSFSPSPSLFL